MPDTERIRRSSVETHQGTEVVRDFNRQLARGEQLLKMLANSAFFSQQRLKPEEGFDSKSEEQHRSLVLLEINLTKKAKPIDELCEQAKRTREQYRDAQSQKALITTVTGQKKRAEDLSAQEVADALIETAAEDTESVVGHIKRQVASGEIKDLIERMREISAGLSNELRQWGDLPQVLRPEDSKFLQALRQEGMREQEKSAEKTPIRAQDLSQGKLTLANYGKPTAIAEGNIGMVYKAEQKYEIDGLNPAGKRIIIPAKATKHVALKVAKDPRKEKQMDREMALAKTIQGIEGLALPTQLLTVPDPEQYFGFAKGSKVLVFPWVEGEHPLEYLRKKMTAKEKGQAAIAMGREIAMSMMQVHGKGLIHRDIKLDNIKITPEGKSILLDFGELIKKGQRPETLSGSATYMPPEAFDFDNYVPNEQADVYALGMSLYILLTGEKDPFRTNGLTGSKEEKMIQTGEIKNRLEKTGEAISLRLEDKELARIVNKALTGKASRYATMEAMFTDLNALFEKQKAEKATKRQDLHFGAKLRKEAEEPPKTPPQPTPEEVPKAQPEETAAAKARKRASRFFP